MNVDFLHELYLRSLEIRLFERGLLDLFDRGLLHGTTHTCIGQEVLPVTVASRRVNGDIFIGNHRSHGHYLSLSKNYSGLLSEIMGMSDGINRGFGGSQHIFDDSCGYMSNGIQGSFLPSAVGIADAIPEGNIVIVYVGDGTFGEGVVYEAMNIAAIRNCRILLILEDNGIAQTTDTIKTTAGSFQYRAQAFGWNYIFVDSRDIGALFSICSNAVSSVRFGKNPMLLHVKSYRLGPHSKGDDTRPPKVLCELSALDPLDSVEGLIDKCVAIKIKNESKKVIDSVFRNHGLDSI